jgi:putative ABC transport system permease protein
MTDAHILLQNLLRNRIRTGLTLVAFALPMAIFVAAISLLVALAAVSKAMEQELRLGVRHKTSIINTLPEGLRRRIEALDPGRQHIIAICGMRWFGGHVPNTPNVIQSLAADADTFPTVFADAELTPAEAEVWSKDRQAAVIGTGLVLQYGWKAGERVTLVSSIPPYLSLEFHIIKVMPTPSRANTFYFRRDYLTESLKRENADSPEVHIFWLKCRSSADLDTMQVLVDREFANSPSETKSESENALIAGFAQAAGNLPGLMRAMAVVVVAIIALVAGNTMMMSFRERARELAVFKAIGFPNRRVFFIVLGESVLLALVGAVSGAALGIAGIPPLVQVLRQKGFLPVASLRVSPLAIVISLLIALTVGVIAGLWPAYQALRLKTVDALRRPG